MIGLHPVGHQVIEHLRQDPFQHLAALMTGSTQQDYADLMLRGGRTVEGNRSRSGQNDKPKSKTSKAKPASKGKKRRG